MAAVQPVDATSPPPSRPSKAPSSTPSTASSAARASERWRWLIMSVLALLTATCFAATGFYLASPNHLAAHNAPPPPPLAGGGDAVAPVDASDWKAAPALGRPLIGEREWLSLCPLLPQWGRRGQRCECVERGKRETVLT